MKPRHKAVFVTIVPSPYQRDLFKALAARSEVALQVYYMESASPDSPWPEAPLQPFERILPGLWLPFRGARWHVNWGFPDCSDADFVVLSSYSSSTGQRLLRGPQRRRLLYWGERMRRQPAGWRDGVQRLLTAPLAGVAAIVAIGRAAEDDYARRFPATRRFCIPYHCDLSAFLAVGGRGGAPGTPFTFLFCGQMIRRKGVDLLIGAFDRMVAAGLDVRLLMVGREAELPGFLAAARPETRARIVYGGFQPTERLPQYFAQSDAFVLPSRHDGWGVVVNQALGAGLPVIVSDAVGAGFDLVEEEVNGARFAAGDQEALQRCMERMAASPETARRWGEASRRKASAITPEAGAESWVRVFDTMAGGQ
jgi:glycosyltransferase involved in cell wall biosynthesis